MRVNVADAPAVKSFPIDETNNLRIVGDCGMREVLQAAQHDLALTQIAHRQLADHKGVRQYPAAIEEVGQGCIAGPKMVDPDRRIDQDHLLVGRRRGIGRKAFSLPPNFASRRALSRSISALSASRTSADFSLTPVNA